MTDAKPIPADLAQWLRAYLAVNMVHARQELQHAEHAMATDPGLIAPLESSVRLGMLRSDVESGSAVLVWLQDLLPAPTRRSAAPMSAVAS